MTADFAGANQFAALWTYWHWHYLLDPPSRQRYNCSRSGNRRHIDRNCIRADKRHTRIGRHILSYLCSFVTGTRAQRIFPVNNSRTSLRISLHQNDYTSDTHNFRSAVFLYFRSIYSFCRPELWIQISIVLVYSDDASLTL